MKVSFCETCGMPVVWARHEFTGNLAPIDAKPSSAGDLYLRELTNGVAMFGRPPQQGMVAPLHTNHAMTCTDPDQWLKKMAAPQAPRPARRMSARRVG